MEYESGKMVAWFVVGFGAGYFVCFLRYSYYYRKATRRKLQADRIFNGDTGAKRRDVCPD